VNCCSSFLMLSMPAPRLPITMPGRAVCTLTFTLLGGALDLDLADARLAQLLLHVLAQADVLVEHLA